MKETSQRTDIDSSKTNLVATCVRLKLCILKQIFYDTNNCIIPSSSYKLKKNVGL